MSCNRREPNDIERKITESIRLSINERNYDLIKPYLSKDFHFEGSDINTSFTSLYSYLNFKLSASISKIDVNYVKDINDSLVFIKGVKHYENYDSDDLEITYKLTNEGAKITKINRIRPHKFPVITRASYKNEEIFGDDPVNNIENLNVLDNSTADSISNVGYTIYYDKELKNESELSLILFEHLDSLLTNKFKINNIERENLFLTTINSNNTVIIGKNRDIPWTMGLYESDSINNVNLTSKIGHTFSHEIIEGTLVQKYNLKGYKFRWFRDGLSEYIAYEYCKIIAPKEAESYFIDKRLTAASRFAKNGNLLDWRANGPIEHVDKGKLYGSEFIYYNEVGQYGRAFKFFKDLFENNDESLIKILKEIEEREDISNEELLEIMSEITNKNITKLISNY
ncbi:hypothetical protein DCC35_13215 [Mangrovivirga cuniculi]|uniref:Uncharacterized protein n=2 Tax=Mangrovivirga cuniculi TaxID=2715131 RepID=A0A4D7K490_9BACT|nr:hypothetical protein DCC35_13215 [Mangrovivirga cuniculi]